MSLTYPSRLATCSSQFLYGKLYTVFPIKAVFLFSLFMVELGVAVSATAQTSLVLVLGRAISGLGCSGIVTGFFV